LLSVCEFYFAEIKLLFCLELMFQHLTEEEEEEEELSCNALWWTEREQQVVNEVKDTIQFNRGNI